MTKLGVGLSVQAHLQGAPSLPHRFYPPGCHLQKTNDRTAEIVRKQNPSKSTSCPLLSESFSFLSCARVIPKFNLTSYEFCLLMWFGQVTSYLPRTPYLHDILIFLLHLDFLSVAFTNQNPLSQPLSKSEPYRLEVWRVSAVWRDSNFLCISELKLANQPVAIVGPSQSEAFYPHPTNKKPDRPSRIYLLLDTPPRRKHTFYAQLDIINCA